MSEDAIDLGTTIASDRRTNPDLSSLIGSRLSGKYRIVRVLGSGGMGMVFEAENESIGRPVAIKVLLPELVARPELASRFEREARVVSQIRHPNIVDVLDFGTDADRSYLVMELLDGEDLSALLEREGRLTYQRAMQTMRPVIRALAESHAKGIIHRDIKPANIFLSRTAEGDQIKVLDFGVARWDAQLEQRLTKTGVALGTAAYMAPEQLRSAKDAGATADQFAVAAVLYQALTACLPHVAQSFARLAVLKTTTAPRDISLVRPDLEATHTEAIMRALSLEPSARFPTIEAFGAALL